MTMSLINDGLSQDRRFLSALKDGYVRVDEMDLADLMSMAQQLSRLIKFVAPHNEQLSTWESFFDSDEAFVLSSIIATDLAIYEKEFASTFGNLDALLRGITSGSIAVDALHSFQLAKRFDDWLRKLNRLDSVSATRAREQIIDLIEKSLAAHLRQLFQFIESVKPDSLAQFENSFDTYWHASGIVANTPDDVPRFLRENFNAFCAGIRVLQTSARELLSVSLGRNNHDPAHGLYLAFLQLFARVQEKINCFPSRHRSFYYEDVLKVRHRRFVPDIVHLVLSADRPGTEVKIGRGTTFSAGRDEYGTDLIYRSGDDLLVNDAKVIDLKTLNLSRNSLCSPENALNDMASDRNRLQRASFVTSATINELLVDSRSDSPGAVIRKPQPLFGAVRPAVKGDEIKRARIGFAIADNIFFLREGARNVSITLRFDTARSEGSISEFTRQLSQILQTSEQDAFFKAFRFMFKISLSGEAGWVDVESYVPGGLVTDVNSGDTNALTIKFTIPDSVAAIVGYSKAIHGDDFKTDLPIVRFLINPDAYFYPYSLISTLVVSEIAIDVEATGCTDIQIYNQLGQLSTNVQFAPFGPVPNIGDYFIVGSHEAATKKLAGFELAIEWANLPHGKEGFAEHYDGYPSQYSNSSFIVALYTLRDRRWIPADENNAVRAFLFRTKKSSTKEGRNSIASKASLNFKNICGSARPLVGVANNDYRYDTMTKDGFFKVVLKSPQQSFGHREYPLALSEAMTAKARNSRLRISRLFKKREAEQPLPNPAYTPAINSISFSYKASSSISFDQVTSSAEGKLASVLIHLHPFGHAVVLPKSFAHVCLFPRFESDGSLVIGIAATSLVGTLALYFHLADDSQPEAGTTAFEFEWYYLADNAWKRLNATHVLSDTTNGFLTSGIVTLEIPPDISGNNTLMPSEIYWLRLASNSQKLEALASLHGVYTNALAATWQPGETNSYRHLLDGLPPGQIREAVPSIAGIRDIRQLSRSVSGLAPESANQRAARISERLSHKGRAVVPRDFERLILDRFPGIYKVKCFPCLTGQENDGPEQRPGELLIVVLPLLPDSIDLTSRPMVNAMLLREVKEFVSQIASPFVHVNVRNPAYIQVQVRCKIKFRSAIAQGSKINELHRTISDYLSPWGETAQRRTFGWHLRCNDIQAYLHGLHDVAAVSGVSLLGICKGDNNYYQLSDSVRLGVQELRPALPWSVAIPAERHLIEVVDANRSWPPEASGITHLAIGSSFIVSRGTQ